MRLVTVSVALLALTLVLWLAAFLFRFGIVNIFDARIKDAGKFCFVKAQIIKVKIDIEV